ncbi:replication fork protection complex subunit Csm3/Swi3 [Puccinia sorghi]|uniref:Chromosome segregation in meiosis protein n=1 Tax=Puccinia sorghi TaxID=27349 RepID=A0A0L6VRB3_9BASI|nr:replication fork protection complex subunit Csm3/Swi3 [Puccinia sorghi]
MLDHAAIEASLAAEKAKAVDPFALISGDQPLKRKVTRRPTVKIDEDRLLDPKIGIPNLITLSKTFKPSGKGKEKDDLKRLIKIYRLWSHSMFPKGTFRDTIDTVEKLCHKRKMRNSLRTWREENGGQKPSKKAKRDECSGGENETGDDGPRPVEAGGADAAGNSEAAAPETETTAVLEGPLFRPAEESEDEFPDDDDDQLCAFLDNVNTVPVIAPTAPVPPPAACPPVPTPAARPPVPPPAVHPPEPQMEWVEALLTEAEGQDSLPPAPLSLPDHSPLPPDPAPQPDTGTPAGKLLLSLIANIRIVFIHTEKRDAKLEVSTRLYYFLNH